MPARYTPFVYIASDHLSPRLILGLKLLHPLRLSLFVINSRNYTRPIEIGRAVRAVRRKFAKASAWNGNGEFQFRSRVSGECFALHLSREYSWRTRKRNLRPSVLLDR
jgi:hypothetical protein